MKKIISLAIAVLMVSACALTTLAATDTYVNTEITIYKKDTAPVIDGVVNTDEYFLIDAWKDGLADLMTGRGPLAENFNVEFYACYTSDAYYFAVVTDCDEHVAYVEGTHYIFSAHHLMPLIVPDDPRKEVYYSGTADGAWTWSDINNLNGVYEMALIENSKTHTNEAAPYFLNMTTKTGFEYKVVSADSRDTYEVKIPFSAMSSNLQTTPLTSETGTIFGFDFYLGLVDCGEDYEDGYSAASDVRLGSGYLPSGAKALSRVAIIELGGEYVEPETPEESSEEPTQEPSTEPTTPTSDAGFIALAIIAVIATAGAFVAKKSR